MSDFNPSDAIPAPRDQGETREQRSGSTRRARLLGAAAVAGGIAMAASGKAQAQTGVPDGFQAASELSNVSSIHVQADGSVELVTTNGETVTMAASDVVVQNGVVYVNSAAAQAAGLTAAAAAGGGAVIGTLAGLGAIGAAAGGGGGDDAAPTPPPPPPPPAPNNPPTFSSAATATTAENNAGTVYTATASDPDGDSISYSLSGTDAGLFNIDSSTGEVSFIAAPDFEAPGDSDSDNVYDIVVTASDGTNTTDQAVSITVTNENDNAPDVTSGNSASIAENSTDIVYTATATDADGDSVTFSLAGDDAALFDIDATTGEVTFKAAPDHENPQDANSDNVYDIIVRASDGTNTTDQAVAVTVTNVNDNAPVLNLPASLTLSGGENQVLFPNGTDADGDVLSYSLSGTDARFFGLDSRTGEVTKSSFFSPAQPLDSDRDGTYEVIVTVTDGVTSVSQTVSVTFTALPEINGNDFVDDNIQGTDANEDIDGLSGNDTIRGGGGNDDIFGGGGDDQLFGEDGDDRIQDFSGDNTLEGGNGDDYMLAVTGNNTLRGGADDDDLIFFGLSSENGNHNVLEGGDGNDFLATSTRSPNSTLVMDGGNGDDSFSILIYDASISVTAIGGDGNDVFGFGSSRNSQLTILGNHTATLGAGQDIVYLRSQPELITITDFETGAGGDTVRFGFGDGISNSWANNPFGTGHLQLVQRGADTVLQIDSDGGADSWTDMLVFQNSQVSDFTAENFLGWNPDGSATVDLNLDGTAGDDVLRGGHGDDTINGGAGNDRINSFEGADVVDGGAGDDSIGLTRGSDIARGGDGNDFIDSLVLLDGETDQLFGSAGNDFIRHNVSTIATNSTASIDAGSGNDWIALEISEAATIDVIGGDGNDTLIYQAYKDGTSTADLGAGDDYVAVGSTLQEIGGTHTLTLGTGRDVLDFVGTPRGYTMTITDFETGAGGDVINFSFDPSSNLWPGGPDPFAANLVWLEQDGANTIVRISLDVPNVYTIGTATIILENTTATDLTADNFGGATPVVRSAQAIEDVASKVPLDTVIMETNDTPPTARTDQDFTNDIFDLGTDFPAALDNSAQISIEDLMSARSLNEDSDSVPTLKTSGDIDVAVSQNRDSLDSAVVEAFDFDLEVSMMDLQSAEAGQAFKLLSVSQETPVEMARIAPEMATALLDDDDPHGALDHQIPAPAETVDGW